MIRTPTWNQKKCGVSLQMFSDVTFHPETISTKIKVQPNLHDYSCEKDSLGRAMSKVQKICQEKNKNHKTSAKTAFICFLFLFGDFNISNIFFKILNLHEWQYVSVITHWTYTFLNPWALTKATPGLLCITFLGDF